MERRPSWLEGLDPTLGAGAGHPASSLGQRPSLRGSDGTVEVRGAHGGHAVALTAHHLSAP